MPKSTTPSPSSPARSSLSIPVPIPEGEVRPAFASTIAAVLRTFEPPPKRTVSEWADEFRRLSREDSAEPGPWSTARAEYQRGIMDGASEPGVHTVVVPKAAQVGWTTMLGNFIGHIIHQDPGPTLVIQPTVDMAEVWSKDRFAPMVRDTPVLHGLLADPKSRTGENTILHKQFPGGQLALVGANAPSGLAARPIRYVIGDELDRWPRSAGTEGDPLSLASKRQTTFWNRRTLLGSTPGLKQTSAIWREWLKSDQRKFLVPCPHCELEQELRWGNVRWEKTFPGGVRAHDAPEDGVRAVEHHPETAAYLCDGCGSLLSDGDRWRAISGGRWEATSVSDGVAGFHVSGLMSPWLTLREIAKGFLDARNDPALLQVWINTVLGEPWEDRGEEVDAGSLLERSEEWGEEAPADVLVVTCGIDHQANRLEVERIGWGVGEESWSLDYRIIYGDPSGAELWRQLDEYLSTPTRTRDGRRLEVRATCIDSGGTHTQEVYDYCKARSRARIWAVKGQGGAGKPIWPRRASRSKRGLWFMVGVDTVKDRVFARLKSKRRGPGAMHFPADRDEEWFQQLTAETVTTTYINGFPVRKYEKPPHARNEALDARVYGYAALVSLELNWQREQKRASTAPRHPLDPVSEISQPPAPVIPAAHVAAPAVAARPRFIRRASRSAFMSGR